MIIAQVITMIGSACGAIQTTGWRSVCAVNDVEPTCIAWTSAAPTAVCAISFEMQSPTFVNDCATYTGAGVLAGASFAQISDLNEWLLEFRPTKAMAGLVLFVQMVTPTAASRVARVPVLMAVPD